ncbi:MAG: SMP-30/gluconolactonase/LRE family protein [Planctomycetaceae bacterium]|nr:SMP-30/gluconolactonase/LRE family protein [Planctomycetaceae bacterium]
MNLVPGGVAVRLTVLLVAAWVSATGFAADPAKVDSLGSIERLDERLDALLPREAVIEKLAEGFNWSEGPVWDPKTKELYFSDVPENVVFAWNEKQGVRQFLKPSGYTGSTPRGGEPGSNGLLLEPGTGKLVLCQHGDRRVARMGEQGKFDTLAGNYDGKRFNSPNDGAYKSNGDLYFTDPPYGLLKLNDDPAKEIPFNGVYRVAPDKTVTLLTQVMTFPNGIAFSPDEKFLYVAQSDPKSAIWRKFPVHADGTLGEGALFFDATDRVGKFKGLPDGMKVDAAGNVFATGPGGVLIFSPDGKHLGTILTGEATGNCCFGDDGSTLYIMADMYLCRVKTTTKGAGM